MISRLTLLALVALVLAPTDPVTGPAGVYTVTTSAPTRITSGPGWIKFEWKTDDTPEPPPPGPVEPPAVKPPPVEPEKPPPVEPPPVEPAGPATPLTGQVWFLAVYDTTKAATYPSAQQAILLPPSKGGSPTINGAMKSLTISWQPHDINDQVLAGSSPDGGSWKADAMRQGIPCLIAIGMQDGKLVSYAFPLPRDEVTAIALGKKVTGK